MNDLDGVEVKQTMQRAEEAELLRQLMELTEPNQNPFQADWKLQIVECYNFKELRQWDGADVQLILAGDTPAIPADRIGRNLDTIAGIREKTGNKKRIVKRETGDETVAMILDRVCDYFATHGDFDDAADESFFSMLDIGIGVQKIGWDRLARGGEGELFSEPCDVESMGWSKTRSKKWRDVRWVWQKSMMSWESVSRLAPERMAEIKSLQTILTDEWEKNKTGGSVQSMNQDYTQAVTPQNLTYSYPGQVNLYEFWYLRTVPYKKVGWIETTLVQNPALSEMNGVPEEMLQMIPPEIPQSEMKYRVEPSDYQVKEGESAIDTYEDEWWQYLVATGNTATSGIILRGEKSDLGFHPYVPKVALYKKSGQPMGFIETVIPHQKRINVSLAQKLAWNNKSIKSPVILRDGDIKDNNIDQLVQQSAIGAVMILSKTAQNPIFNTQPPVNLQAIEEGNVARQDMDFAAAASEPALRGVANASTSGVELSMRQSAAVTPLNKWVKAESGANQEFWRKALKIVAMKCPPERVRRIIGEQLFDSLTAPQMSPMGILPPALQLPFLPDATDYDVEIQDQAVSDLDKQQSFNATETLAQSGVVFDDEFRIKNAPIKDTDAALASNVKQKQDIMQQMVMQIQQLSEENKILSKQVNRPKGNPVAQGPRGRSAPQTRQSMIGGTSPSRP